MNLKLLAWQLGLVSLLIGGSMGASLPWALPQLGETKTLEVGGLFGLLASMMVCAVCGGWLLYVGREARHQTLFRKEAMAVVGISWILATVLGALPFWFSGTFDAFSLYRPADALPLTFTGKVNNFLQAMGDGVFESQSGFSTTGATVISKLDDVPRSILFWRSSTHFLGGLGIIVLFVAILGQGSAGKALMRAEMPGPSKDTTQHRVQHAALVFATLYIVLNLVLTGLLKLEGMSWFDALCHAFGTLATGGFSTYDDSLGHFARDPNSLHGWFENQQLNGAIVEMTVLVFMVLAGMNFSLIYLLMKGRFKQVFGDVELRVYLGVLLLMTCLVVAFGHFTYDDFKDADGKQLMQALRFGSFQVVSIMTTTGFGTHDFDQWNSFGRGVLFLLMFVGGCAGSTGGGLKVIRHVLFLKILWLEVERVYRPNVVRPLWLGGKPIEDRDLSRNILVYFGTVLVIFIFSWLALITTEPDRTWALKGHPVENKLIDSATAVSATLNNIGPGLGTIGATQNYGHFSWPSKFLFTILMMLGRLEVFVIVVLFVPGFWRNH